MVSSAWVLAISTSDAVGLVAAIVSIILAGFAIWQAATFYKWSNAAQHRATEASREIKASVHKLEAIFNRLYSDTFGMMRDTVADMRKHVWYARDGEDSDADRAQAERLQRLRDELGEEIERLGRQLGDTTTQVESVESQIATLVDRALQESKRAVTPRRDDPREAILASLQDADRRGEALTMDDIADLLDLSRGSVASALFDARGAGDVTWPGDGSSLNADQPVSLTDRGRSHR